MEYKKYLENKALALIVRDFFANNGLNPEDPVDDQWQLELREKMWHVSVNADIDPCEIACALLWYYQPEHYQHWKEDALDTFAKYDIRKHIPFYNN